MHKENTNIINRPNRRSRDNSSQSKQSKCSSSYSKSISSHRKIRQLKNIDERRLYESIVKTKKESSSKFKSRNSMEAFKQDIELVKSIITSKDCYNLCQNRQKAIFNAFYDQQEVQEAIKQKSQLLFRVREKINSIKSHRQGSLSGRSDRDKSLNQADNIPQQKSEVSNQSRMIRSLVIKYPSRQNKLRTICKHERSISQRGNCKAITKNSIRWQTSQSRNIENSLISQVNWIKQSSNQLDKQDNQLTMFVHKNRIEPRNEVKIANSVFLTSQKKKKNLGDFIRFKKDRLNFQGIR